jgi:beta-glucosidase-like glycosyl hydrolase
MGAAGNKSAEENSVSALNAGCDMVMAWPNNVISIHSAILKSLRMGKIKRERLVDAASHIIKHRSRLH